MDVHCGVFEAESHWREKDLATLPSLADAASARITAAMDELLFVFCEPGDKLLTLRKMDDSHFDYLQSIGFSFERNEFNLTPKEENDGNHSHDVYGQIAKLTPTLELQTYLTTTAMIQPFAAIPSITEFARNFDLSCCHLPSCDVVRQVNTKSYALDMRNRHDISHNGVVIEGISSFMNTGKAILAKGPLLVKDEYGVSGKGNHLITTAGALNRLGNHLAKQQLGGKRVKFVLEPFLNKELDFSCQFHISKDGQVEVLCVQQLDNQGLAFGRSRTPDKNLTQVLESFSYFDMIHDVGKSMATDGYFGDVCVDSMLLADRTLFPIVEINARKSMSLIKHRMDRNLAKLSVCGCLTSVSFSHDGTLSFEALLVSLKKNKLLFESGASYGVVPLSSGTTGACHTSAPDSSIRGRLYIELVADTLELQDQLLHSVEQLLECHGCRLSRQVPRA